MAGTELVKCPMLKENIDVAYCIELQMIANKEIKPTQSEEHFTAKDYAVCLKCKKQVCPTPDIIS